MTLGQSPIVCGFPVRFLCSADNSEIIPAACSEIRLPAPEHRGFFAVPRGLHPEHLPVSETLSVAGVQWGWYSHEAGHKTTAILKFHAPESPKIRRLSNVSACGCGVPD